MDYEMTSAPSSTQTANEAKKQVFRLAVMRMPTPIPSPIRFHHALVLHSDSYASLFHANNASTNGGTYYYESIHGHQGVKDPQCVVYQILAPIEFDQTGLEQVDEALKANVPVDDHPPASSVFNCRICAQRAVGFLQSSGAPFKWTTSWTWSTIETAMDVTWLQWSFGVANETALQRLCNLIDKLRQDRDKYLAAVLDIETQHFERRRRRRDLTAQASRAAPTSQQLAMLSQEARSLDQAVQHAQQQRYELDAAYHAKATERNILFDECRYKARALNSLLSPSPAQVDKNLGPSPF